MNIAVVSIIVFIFLICGSCVSDLDSEHCDEEIEKAETSDPKAKARPPDVDQDERIIGGVVSQIGDFPGIVSLRDPNGLHFCGGTLIDNRHVVTAAHCFVLKDLSVINPSEIEVMGDDLMITPHGSPSRQTRQVSHIFLHYSYNHIETDNDIAVIRISAPFVFHDFFHALPLAELTPISGTNCTVGGWGSTTEGSRLPSPLLQKINIQVYSLNKCNNPKSYDGELHLGQICAGVMAGGKDACQGDSGGGLICDGTLTGTVSYGVGCGRRNFPGVYTDVSIYKGFINDAKKWTKSYTDFPMPINLRGFGKAASPRLTANLNVYVVLVAFSVSIVMLCLIT